MILTQLASVAGKQGRADAALALVAEARALVTTGRGASRCQIVDTPSSGAAARPRRRRQRAMAQAIGRSHRNSGA